MADHDGSGNTAQTGGAGVGSPQSHAPSQEQVRVLGSGGGVLRFGALVALLEPEAASLIYAEGFSHARLVLESTSQWRHNTSTTDATPKR